MINASNTYTNFPVDQYFKHFESNFSGPIIIAIELNKSSTSTDSWYLLKWAKFLSNNFFSINNIKLNGHRKVKILFDSINFANACFNSPILLKNNLSAYIPSTLIYSYGIIKLDISFLEADFWDGQNFNIPINAFKHFSVNTDGIITPTHIVEYKSLSSKIPSSMSIFNMIFDFSLSIRYPLQCNLCLYFGHAS